jgi:AcrR family transcriptional regulator
VREKSSLGGKHMVERRIPAQTESIKDRILDVALKHFALKGFSGVSVKDIAEIVGINPGTIYNYFDGKESIMEAVIDRFEEEYSHYFSWLIEQNAKVETLEELMDNMFAELIKVRDLTGYYGMALLLGEQFCHEPSRERVFKLFYRDSINWMKDDLERLMKKGVIPQGDSRTIATILMWFVLTGNDIRIHEQNGNDLPLDCTEMYTDLKVFLTKVLRTGI